MRKQLHRFVFTAVFATGISVAQEPNPAPHAQKPYFVSPDNMLMRCNSPEFLKCMKWSATQCTTIITTAVAEGNAKVEAEAAQRLDTETNSDFFKGYAAGVVIGTIHAVSKGKLLNCISARKA